MHDSPELRNALARAYDRRGVIAVECGLVRDGDDFHYARGLEPKLHHVATGVSKRITHAWAVVTRQVGNTVVKVFAVIDDVDDEALMLTWAIEEAAHLIPEQPEEGDDEA